MEKLTFCISKNNNYKISPNLLLLCVIQQPHSQSSKESSRQKLTFEMSPNIDGITVKKSEESFRNFFFLFFDFLTLLVLTSSRCPRSLWLAVAQGSNSFRSADPILLPNETRLRKTATGSRAEHGGMMETRVPST